LLLDLLKGSELVAQPFGLLDCDDQSRPIPRAWSIGRHCRDRKTGQSKCC